VTGAADNRGDYIRCDQLKQFAIVIGLWDPCDTSLRIESDGEPSSSKRWRYAPWEHLQAGSNGFFYFPERWARLFDRALLTSDCAGPSRQHSNALPPLHKRHAQGIDAGHPAAKAGHDKTPYSP